MGFGNVIKVDFENLFPRKIKCEDFTPTTRRFPSQRKILLLFRGERNSSYYFNSSRIKFGPNSTSSKDHSPSSFSSS